MGEFINPADVPKVKFYTGDEAPCIGMGTFGSDRFTADQIAEAVDGAIKSGYRMFDCAACYGNEPEIGKVFKNAFDEGIVERKDLFIMTKVWNDMHEHVEEACKKSIADLQCDYVDMYYIHWPFPNYHAPKCDVESRNPDSKPFSVEEFMDTYRQCEELVEKGKIRYIGCSNFSGWHLMKSLSVSERYGWSRYVAQQVYYSLLNREFEWELMPLGIDQKVGAIIWSPLSAGRLGGKYRRNNPIPTDGRVARGGSPIPDEATSYERLYDIVEVLEQVAEETGHSVAQCALNWLLQRPTVSSLIIGARTEEQLRQNLEAVGWNLSPEQVKRLDMASQTTPIYPYWHQAQFPELNSQLRF